MSQEHASKKATLATIVATAAVTVAVGVTVAALGGYLVPAKDEAALATAPAEAAPEPLAPPVGPANVVLVPVVPDAPAIGESPVIEEPGTVLVSHEAREHHRHEDRRHERKDDDDDDHDDERELDHEDD